VIAAQVVGRLFLFAGHWAAIGGRATVLPVGRAASRYARGNQRRPMSNAAMAVAHAAFRTSKLFRLAADRLDLG